LQLSWSTELKPYHERLVSEIRAIDPDNLIILGTPNWSQYVDEASDDPVAGTNLAYTLHFYSCTHKADFRQKGDWALRRNVALFVTEWGATHADGGTPTNPGLCLEEADAWHEWMNTNQISWAAWKLDDCGDESCYFTAGAPVDGSFSADQLKPHGAYIRDKMLAPAAAVP
jgi:endoglucanase